MGLDENVIDHCDHLSGGLAFAPQRSHLFVSLTLFGFKRGRGGEGNEREKEGREKKRGDIASPCFNLKYRKLRISYFGLKRRVERGGGRDGYLLLLLPLLHPLPFLLYLK